MKNKNNYLKLLLFSFMLVTAFSIAGGNQIVFAEPEGVEPPKWTRNLPADACPGTSDTNCHWGSPVLAHINGDNFLDIVVVTNNGHILAVSHNNTLLWQNDIAGEFNMAAGTHEIASSPAVGDLDNDGTPEIAVGVGSNFNANCTVGGLIVLDHNGAIEWRYIAVAENNDACPNHPDTIFSTPALADIDNDGKLEVIAGGFDRRIYAWNHDGSFVDGFSPDSEHRLRFPTWPNLNGALVDTIWGSPAVADLTNNGVPDILIGTDEGDFGPSWGGDANGWTCPYASPDYCGGSIYGLTGAGVLLKYVDPAYDFPRRFLEIIQSTPAVADVNSDGYPEIFFGTGTYYYDNSPDHPTHGFRLYGTDRFGHDLPGWQGGKTMGGPTPASPAIGDITGDSKPEIIMGSLNEKKLYAYHADGSLVPGFPMTPKAQNGIAFNNYNVGSSFVLADYDGDGKMEIFLNQGWSIAIVDGNGQQLTMTNYPNDNRPLYLTSGTLMSVPAVGDIDNDGKLELVVSNSKLYVWDLDSSSNQADWPMFKRDAARTSAYPQPPSMLASPNSLTAFHQAGQSGMAESTFVIKNTGGAAFNWSINPISGVTITPSQGSLNGGESIIVTIKIQVNGSTPPGTYSQGNLVVAATSDEGPVVNNNTNIDVQLVVGNISNSYIPIVQK